MLSQAHMGAPLYRYTSQVGPRFGDYRPLFNCENDAITSQLRLFPPQSATHILIRHKQSVLVIGMLSQGNMGAPFYRYTGQVGPRFVKSGSLV